MSQLWVGSRWRGREGCGGGGGGELRRLKVMLPDRTPLQLHDCSAFAAAAQLTGLQLCGHASAEAVQQVSPDLLIAPTHPIIGSTAPNSRAACPHCHFYHPRNDVSSALSVVILSRHAS